MQELRDRVAVVTGAGSGIGRGIAIAFADAGMRVVVADIEQAAGEKVAAELGERGARALAVRTDVTDLASLRELEARTRSELGGVHVLVNNAGVAHFGPLVENTEADWDWLLGVNLRGVVNGLLAFLPGLRDQADPAHVVSTASMAGLMPVPTLGSYCATKYAVVAITETLRLELQGSGVSCSVLCPGVVNTRIFDSDRNRPEALGGPLPEMPDEAKALMAQAGKDPLEVGRMVRQGVIDDDLYIISHPEAGAALEARGAAIGQAFAKWAEWTDPGE